MAASSTSTPGLDIRSASAAMADADPTAPRFLLQGWYRNTARIAGRIAPVTTDGDADDRRCSPT